MDMDGMDKEEFERRSKYAAEKMFQMRDNAMPPMPPFVRTGKSGNASENHRENYDEQKPEKPKKGGLFGKDILKLIDFKNFEMDSDRMLILLMFLLLSGEGSDEILLFALAYIML